MDEIDKTDSFDGQSAASELFQATVGGMQERRDRSREIVMSVLEPEESTAQQLVQLSQ
jgi:hypothetical protein